MPNTSRPKVQVRLPAMVSRSSVSLYPTVVMVMAVM